MKQKLILSLFLFLLLAGVIAIYNRTRSSFETFQDNSEANRYLIKYFDINKDFIEAKDVDISKGYKLLLSEGLFCEPSSAAVIGSLGKLKEKN